MPAAELSRALDALVERFLALPPTSVRAAKRLSARAFDLELDAFRAEARRQATDGIAAVLARTGERQRITASVEAADVRIELPGNLGKAAKAMKMFGKGEQVEALETSMNKAAEAAVPQAQAILVDAVKNMSVTDAKGILAGGDDSATQYLNKSSREQIRAKFLPIVKQATDKVGLAQQYNNFAGQAVALGVVDAKSASIENYVTEKALDGLFEMIAKQEQSIRQNPAEAATSLAKKVFGAL